MFTFIFHSDRGALHQARTVIHHYPENQKFPAVYPLRNESDILSDRIWCGSGGS